MLEGKVKVTKTVRVHETALGRFVRVTGDGTPENTRITDMDGELIAEPVVEVWLTIAAGRCAKGVFKCLKTYEGELVYEHDPRTGDRQPMHHEFEAWVVFEPPPEPVAPTPSEPKTENAALRLELEAARESIAVLTERIAAASFALGNGVGCASSGCDTRIPGPGVSELLDIVEPERHEG